MFTFPTMTLFQHPWGIDLAARQGLSHMSSPGFDRFFGAITQLGGPWALTLLTVLALVYLLYQKKIGEGLFLTGSMLIAWAAMHYLKLAFARPRPPGEQLTYAHGYSFPSGHAMLSLLFYGFVAYLILVEGRDKKHLVLAGGCMVLILLIGVSRAYLNVHYASDVLGGYFFGGMLLLGFIKTMNWMGPRGLQE